MSDNSWKSLQLQISECILYWKVITIVEVMELSLFAIYSLFVSLFMMEVSSTTPELRELDKFIKHAMACNKIVGLSVSLVKGGNTVFSRGFGHVNGEGPDFKEKATEHSEFCIGSLTKAFTSTVIADVLSKQDR